MALIGLVAIGLSQIATVILSGIAAGAEIRAISKLLLVAGARDQRERAGNGVPLPDVGAGHVEDGVAGRGVRGCPVHAAALFGTVVVSRMIANASEIYGTFAPMLALMSWFGLHALISLYGAELNAALERRRSNAAT